jgi:hypothetical protein
MVVACRLTFAALLAALAVAYLAVGWQIVFDVKIGATVMVLTATHGVHQGDVLGVAAFMFGAVCAVGSVVSAASVAGRRRVRSTYRPHPAR